MKRGAPGQIAKAFGVPPEKGVPPEEGIPPEQGVPIDEAVLPGADGQLDRGAPGQVDRGAPGQMDPDAPNPWAIDGDGEEWVMLPPEDEEVAAEGFYLQHPNFRPETGGLAADSDEPGTREPGTAPTPPDEGTWPDGPVPSQESVEEDGEWPE